MIFWPRLRDECHSRTKRRERTARLRRPSGGSLPSLLRGRSAAAPLEAYAQAVAVLVTDSDDFAGCELLASTYLNNDPLMPWTGGVAYGSLDSRH